VPNTDTNKLLML